MSNLKLFTLSLFSTTIVALLYFFVTRSQHPAITPISDSDNIFFSPQVKPDDLRYIRSRGITTIIDLRPDGEDAKQTNHSEMESLARRTLLDFYYIPIPHATIPSTSVDALTGALAAHPRDVLLYCRTGRRAVRTFALAQASRPDGPNQQRILEMVKQAGFSADDLRDTIAARISARRPVQTNP